MEAIRLKTEYLTNPIGIDCAAPRLFWNCAGGKRQTACRILAEGDGGVPLWDSGKTASASMRARWGGAPVPPGTRVTWRVLLWDETDTPGAWSEAAFFETGIGAWRAQWIAGDYRVRRGRRYPVDCFRKTFSAPPVRKARLYITACGLYEARLNGVRAGESVLAPGITDYRKRVQYQTYDVTELLREGANTLTVQLADGWYRGSCGAWGRKNQYGTQTKLLAQLEITGEDGSVTTVVSDGGREGSSDGPLRFADIQDGERVDAARVPSYAGRARTVSHRAAPAASNNVPVTEHERLKPARLVTPSGKIVLDFGQNIAGYVEFTVHAAAGQRIFLRFGELLDRDGEFTQKNIQCSSKKVTTPLQQVEYLCREGENRYKTTFAIFGFQYVLVETDVSFRPEDFTAVAVYSDLERTGWFESSNELLNRFVENTVWSAKNNHADLPTDCPTRERHGWTGDAQIFCSTASYLFDYAAFARKYERDLTDAQHKNGCFPQIVPVGGTDFYMRSMDGSAGWSDAGVFLPWEIYHRYGDDAILKDNYDAMKAYARFKVKSLGRWYPTARPTGVHGKPRRWISNYGQSYGEWAEPADVKPMVISDFVSPHPEESTAYLVLLLDRMAEIAAILGKKADADEYHSLAGKVRLGYQALVRTEKHSLDTDRQAKLVRPLALRLLDETQTVFAQRRLVQALDRYGWRLGTGFLSTPLILYVLADMDIAFAYRLLENEEIPGWLSMPKNGATTIWESWEGPGAQGGVASLNHYSKGAVCQWLFDTMCGIRGAGENRFLIAPRPGGSFTRAGAKYNSVFGMAESGWEKTETGWRFRVTVPAGCTAKVVLPDGSAREQEAGTASYTV